MPSIRIRASAEGDEFVGVDAVYVAREPDSYIAQKEPRYRSWLWGAGFGFHSIDTVVYNLSLMGLQEYAELKARNGTPIWVRMDSVTDCDKPLSPGLDGDAASILRFGVGNAADRLAILQTKDELKSIWKGSGRTIPNFLEQQ